MRGQTKTDMASGRRTGASRVAKGPRNLESYSEAELIRRFAELIPGTFGEDVLKDPLNKGLVREFDARIAARDVMEHFVRAWGGGEISLFHADRLSKSLLTQAKLVGNLGERVKEMPDNPVLALIAILKEKSADSTVEVLLSMGEIAQQQKVLETNARSD